MDIFYHRLKLIAGTCTPCFGGPLSSGQRVWTNFLDKLHGEDEYSLPGLLKDLDTELGDLKAGSGMVHHWNDWTGENYLYQ